MRRDGSEEADRGVGAFTSKSRTQRQHREADKGVIGMAWKDFLKRHVTALLLVVTMGFLIAAAIAASILVHGISARDEPTYVEGKLARLLRHYAVPRKMRSLRNPLAETSEAIASGRMHFADHCATCHGNDGSGGTEIGQSLYPKAPDMRTARTQSLTDGEIFAFIKNGIRLTGMPAWGDAAGHDDSENWKLVAFIRHLPTITPEELEEMKRMNPINPMEMDEDRQEKAFLESKAASPAPVPNPKNHHSERKKP
jgi:mono/diheme cytochrome c family protein